jgi:putative methionine-R-sulfoxide reductase with GAF domain
VSDVIAALSRAVDSESPREQRARAACSVVAGARGYRWVGIYDVGDDEIALIGYAGTAPPDHLRSSVEEGLSGEAVRTRRTVVSSEIIVPILGAESGIVIGTLEAESDRVGAFTVEDVAFLEECASVLRPLYD